MRRLTALDRWHGYGTDTLVDIQYMVVQVRNREMGSNDFQSNVSIHDRLEASRLALLPILAQVSPGIMFDGPATIASMNRLLGNFVLGSSSRLEYTNRHQLEGLIIVLPLVWRLVLLAHTTSVLVCRNCILLDCWALRGVLVLSSSDQTTPWE
jgi:hypothetical protein